MDIKEISDVFDSLTNNYNKTNGTSLSFDEYEKSIYLTQAQEQIAVELYNGANTKNTAFEVTEEARESLKSLIKTKKASALNDDNISMSKYSKFFTLPNDILFITSEYVIFGDDAGCKAGEYIPVVPVLQDELHSIMQNPFRGSNRRRVLRLDADNGYIAELISEYSISEYILRYLSKPKPIILSYFNNQDTDFENVSLNNIEEPTGISLDESMHMTIVQRAVLLAITSGGISTK